MKRLILLVSLLLSTCSIYAATVNQLIFFGDSSSDNGNMYRISFGFIPKSPPYYQGRFSNGPTWAENLGQMYSERYHSTYEIFAVGGATALNYFGKITPRYENQINDYVKNNSFEPNNQTLFATLIGANDYINNQDDDAETLTTNVVNKIVWSIETLANNVGAKNFLVLNLPDMSMMPRANTQKMKVIMRTFVKLHNKKLAKAVGDLQKRYPHAKFTLINTYALFNDVIANTEKYNEKYQVHLVNTTDACLPDKFTALAEKQLDNQWQLTLVKNLKQSGMQIDNPNADLSVTLKSTAMSALSTPCSKPDEYLFWDAVHPTKPMHQILAQVVAEQLLPPQA